MEGSENHFTSIRWTPLEDLVLAIQAMCRSPNFTHCILTVFNIFAIILSNLRCLSLRDLEHTYQSQNIESRPSNLNSRFYLTFSYGWDIMLLASQTLTALDLPDVKMKTALTQFRMASAANH